MSEQWPLKTLGEVCERVCVGFVGSTSKHYRDEGVLFLRTKNVGRTGEVNLDDVKYITRDFHDSTKKSQLQSGDVILSRVVTDRINCALIPDNFPDANCANVVIVRPGLEVDSRFLVYYIKSKASQDYLLSKRKGSAQLVVNTTIVKQWPVRIPPLDEQKRIVSILDEAFQNIENRTSQAEHKLHNGKEMLQSVIANIFSQKGEGWTEKTLGEVCENLDRKRIPITKNKRVSGEIPYYGASGIVDYVKDYIFDEDLLLVSEDGANLLARTYPIAFSISGKTWVNNHAHVLRFEDMATQRFMEYYLNSIRLEPYVSGMAQPKLNQKSLNSIPVPEPPINQQQSIVNKLDSLSQNVGLLEENCRNEVESLVELKQSVLQETFAGNL